MEFKKYQHIKRFGHDDVKGIEIGVVYIFPKIDGTNGSIWYENGELQFGSRNQYLGQGGDNQGFRKALCDDSRLHNFFKDNPDLRLYGEWLVPHTFKGYRDNAWNKFYVFDVKNDYLDVYLHYDQYSKLLEKYDIDYIPAMVAVVNPSYKYLEDAVDANKYLTNGEIGEGIVIKNYNFINKYGNVVWAKIVRQEFKDTNLKVFGPQIKTLSLNEDIICKEFLSKTTIDKVYAKIEADTGWSSQMIPRLLGTVWHDFVNEEIWSILKKMKNPCIDFKSLYKHCIARVKELKPELF